MHETWSKYPAFLPFYLHKALVIPLSLSQLLFSSAPVLLGCSCPFFSYSSRTQSGSQGTSRKHVLSNLWTYPEGYLYGLEFLPLCSLLYAISKWTESIWESWKISERTKDSACLAQYLVSSSSQTGYLRRGIVQCQRKSGAKVQWQVPRTLS